MGVGGRCLFLDRSDLGVGEDDIWIDGLVSVMAKMGLSGGGRLYCGIVRYGWHSGRTYGSSDWDGVCRGSACDSKGLVGYEDCCCLWHSTSFSAHGEAMYGYSRLCIIYPVKQVV